MPCDSLGLEPHPSPHSHRVGTSAGHGPGDSPAQVRNGCQAAPRVGGPAQALHHPRALPSLCRTGKTSLQA